MENKKITPEDLDAISGEITSKGFIKDNTQIIDASDIGGAIYRNTIFIPAYGAKQQPEK